MKKIFVGVISLLMMLAFASCDNGQKGPQEKPLAEFSITMNDVERTIEVGVNPSDSSVYYVFDLLTEEEYLAVGANEEGIKQLVSDEIASGEAMIASGVTSYEYTDLLYMSTYYAYAVQIDNNDGVVTVNGTPVVMNKSLKKSFTTFEPQEMAIAPFAISDNGYYLVGNFQDGSYLYDLRRDELTIVPAIALNDITNDGIAFGQDLTSYEGVIYRNGEIEYVQGIEGAAETCFFSVNPEGTLAVGYCMDAAYSIVPIKYENGVVSALAYPVSADGAPVAHAAAKTIGANGVIAGYGLMDSDYSEVSVAWNLPDGSDRVLGKDLMDVNSETEFWNYIYGDMFTYVSPNGKYIASNLSDFTEGFMGAVEYAYLYDVEADEFITIDDPAIHNYPVDGVMSNGDVFFKNVPYGLGDHPYVYSKSDATVYTLKEYMRVKFGYETENPVEGSLITVSDDCKIFVTCTYGDNTGYVTNIFVM